MVLVNGFMEGMGCLDPSDHSGHVPNQPVLMFISLFNTSYLFTYDGISRTGCCRWAWGRHRVENTCVP